MAGAGFKTFATGEVLTATNVNTYLMQQTVMVFASSAARSTALGANVSEGMISYLTDTNKIEYYSGTAWTDIAPAASGGLTQIATGSLSSTAVNITSIPGTYKHLQLVVRNFLPATDGQDLYMRFNADSATRYNQNQSTFTATNQTFGSTFISIHQSPDNTVDRNLSIVNIYDYANTTTWKLCHRVNVSTNDTTTTNLNYITGIASYNQTAAITQINLLPQSGSFTSGTYILYGVS